MELDAILSRDGAVVSRSPWGEDDEIGRLNWLLDGGARVDLFERADHSRVFDLAVTYEQGMPSWTYAGDPPFESWMTHTPTGTVNERLNGLPRAVLEKYSYSGDAVSLYLHCGTHIDSLNHRGYFGMCWNGWREADHLGSRRWHRAGVDRFPPIVGRGILLDVAGFLGLPCLADGYGITADDLRATAAAQRVELRPRDVVLVRTGRMASWPDPDAYMLDSPGVTLDAARFLCEEASVMCAGTDTIGFETMRQQPGEWMPVHSYMLATAGAPIIEVLDLEELARERVFEFLFVATPMKVRGATGAPIGALAIPVTS